MNGRGEKSPVFKLYSDNKHGRQANVEAWRSEFLLACEIVLSLLHFRSLKGGWLNVLNLILSCFRGQKGRCLPFPVQLKISVTVGYCVNVQEWTWQIWAFAWKCDQLRWNIARWAFYKRFWKDWERDRRAKTSLKKDGVRSPLQM